MFALILRGVALELRPKSLTETQKRVWDYGLFIGSLVPSILFGIAFGNIFMVLQFDEAGYYGTFFGLLNPYGLTVGLLFYLHLLFMVDCGQL